MLHTELTQCYHAYPHHGYHYLVTPKLVDNKHSRYLVRLYNLNQETKVRTEVQYNMSPGADTGFRKGGGGGWGPGNC